jgi:ribosomal protein S21
MEVRLKDWEEKTYNSGGFESLLNRFTTLIQASGLLSELKRRQEYEKPNEKRRRKKNESMMKKNKKERRNRNAIYTPRNEDKAQS